MGHVRQNVFSLASLEAANLNFTEHLHSMPAGDVGSIDFLKASFQFIDLTTFLSLTYIT